MENMEGHKRNNTCQNRNNVQPQSPKINDITIN